MLEGFNIIQGVGFHLESTQQVYKIVTTSLCIHSSFPPQKTYYFLCGLYFLLFKFVYRAKQPPYSKYILSWGSPFFWHR